jgi:hypothetical protein
MSQRSMDPGLTAGSGMLWRLVDSIDHTTSAASQAVTIFLAELSTTTDEFSIREPLANIQLIIRKASRTYPV